MKMEELRFPPAVKDFHALLRFLEDPEAYKKKLDALEEATAQLNDRFKKLGAVSNIEALTVKAENLHQQAVDELASAKQKTKEIVAAVEESKAANDEEFNRLGKAESTLTTDREKFAQVIKSERQEVATLRKRADDDAATAADDLRKAKAMQTEYRTKMNDLKRFTAQV